MMNDGIIAYAEVIIKNFFNLYIDFLKYHPVYNSFSVVFFIRH